MSEPRYLAGDDVALGINQECDTCEKIECGCGEPDPDRLHDEMGEM
jgi:hypothetical protein